MMMLIMIIMMIMMMMMKLTMVGKQHQPQPQLTHILLLLPCVCYGLMGLQMRGVNGDDHEQESNHATRYRLISPRSTNTDKILELQCVAICEQRPNVLLTKNQLETCRSQCRAELVEKKRRGNCPTERAAVSKLMCLQGECQYDFHCPEVQKCCKSPCGYICMEAIGLHEDSLLPPIPKILDARVRGRKAEISIQSSANSTYYTLVEARHHIGLKLNPRKFGKWQEQPVIKIAEDTDYKSKRTEVEFDLKPGRWYQVRAAAINANGLRGYSDPSKAFRMHSDPKAPKKPSDLKVTSARFDGKTYQVRIAWCPSKSNLPVEKYKIVWSLYVSDGDESLISNEAFVKDTNHFEIPGLLPDSSYYIQVQGISIYGNRRLKSKLSSKLFNTTMEFDEQQQPQEPLKCNAQRQRKIMADEPITPGNSKKYHEANATKTTATTTATATTSHNVRFRLNRKIGMIVHISGFQPSKKQIFELCPKDSSCEHREYNAIRARKDTLEFSKLKYDTTYVLKPVDPSGDRPSRVSSADAFMFTTPKCENFRKRFPKMQIKC